MLLSILYLFHIIYSINFIDIKTYNGLFTCWISELIKFLKKFKGNNILNISKFIVTMLSLIVPTYTNHINTSYQYAADNTQLNLPKCFD